MADSSDVSGPPAAPTCPECGRDTFRRNHAPDCPVGQEQIRRHTRNARVEAALMDAIRDRRNDDAFMERLAARLEADKNILARLAGGYVVIDESHDVPETSSSERQHVLDRSCWCRPLVDGNAVKHRVGSLAEGVAYDNGYRDGESSYQADWDLALEDMLPDDVEALPTQVAEYIRRLKAGR